MSKGTSVKTLKRMLKKAGLKLGGRKAALTRRAKKAGLKLRGGDDAPCTTSTGAAGRCVALPARSDTRLPPASKDTVPPFPPPYMRTDGPAPTFLPKRSGGRSRKH